LLLDGRLAAPPSDGATRSTWLLRLLVVALLVGSGPGFDRLRGTVERNLLGGRGDAFQLEWNAAEVAPPLGWWSSIEGIASIAERLPSGASIALSEYGYVGARAPEVTLIDMVGLHSPEIARNGFSASALLEEQPDLIWLPHHDYRDVLHALLESERLWAEYDVYVGAFDFGVAVRRESVNRERVLEAFMHAWRERYGALDVDRTRARPGSM
jgi:hypothetical protein